MKSATIALLATLTLITAQALLGEPMPSWAAMQLYFIVLIAHKVCKRGERWASGNRLIQPQQAVKAYFCTTGLSTTLWKVDVFRETQGITEACPTSG